MKGYNGDLYGLRDILDCRYFAGRSIGNITDQQYLSFMSSMANIYEYLNGNGNDYLRKLLVTGFLQKLLNILNFAI